MKGKRAITADTALRLSAFFKNSALFWMNIQDQYDLEVERNNDVEYEKITAHADLEVTV